MTQFQISLKIRYAFRAKCHLSDFFDMLSVYSCVAHSKLQRVVIVAVFQQFNSLASVNEQISSMYEY